MPDIKIDHVVSCSSEDKHQPATNLIQPGSYKKWRCEKPGEQSATVIFQLAREEQIHMIDIGNNGSAFVEVLVSKSSASPDTPYQVLLPASSFMTPLEGRNSEQLTRVRMFAKDKLCADVVNKKWDRVKVVCTQPYGAHLQYGISFITLHAPEEAPTLGSGSPSSPQAKLGRFTLRAEDQEEDIRPGALFARRREHKDEASPHKPKTAAAQIAAASSPSSLAAMEGASGTKPALLGARKRPAQENREHNNKRNGTDSPGSSKFTDNRKTLERDTPPPESPSPPPPSASPPRPPKPTTKPKKATTTKPKAQPSKPKAQPSKPGKPPKQRRPFTELMSGVTFVLSGFVNPLRGELRDKALAMGAKYKGDWERGCTHLVCAFANTPKARQVRGRGKIVKPDWILHCHRERKLFPWRRYALDPNEEDKSESEEEIWEQTDEAGSSSSSAGEKKSNKAGEKKSKSPPPTSSQASTSQEVPDTQSEDEYDADTDVDSEGALVSTLPELPDPLTGLTFALHEDILPEVKTQLRRYVIALGGSVLDDLDESVQFLITQTSEGLTELEAFYPEVTPVSPEFVWQCQDAGKLVPHGAYIVHSSQ